jgi:hypothetical protein
MVPLARGPLAALAVVSVATAAVGLVPEFYQRWWWWDVVVHAVAGGLFAVWAYLLGIGRRWRWPTFAAAMLGWEWLELWVAWFLSPNRHDVLLDLTVNVLAFWAVLYVLERVGGPTAAGSGREVRG